MCKRELFIMLVQNKKIGNKFRTAAKWGRAQALSWRKCPSSSNLQKLNMYRGKVLKIFGKLENKKIEPLKIIIDQKL